MKHSQKLGLLTLALLSAAPAAHAVTIYGVTLSNGLVSFDSATPNLVTTIGIISQPGIVDIDFYPFNGLLYAFTASGNGYRLNLANATATQVITPSTALDGSVTDTDFNPAADRVRVFTNGPTTENFRLTPDVFNNAGLTANGVNADGNFSDLAAVLVGSAYNNNFDGTASTTLYSIDTTANTLVIHSGTPQFNTITAVGAGLGVAVGSNVGFDIGQNGIAYLSDNNSFYTVDLGTGVATSVGSIASASGVVTIAALAVPEPSTAVLGLLGLAGLISRRQRRA